MMQWKFRVTLTDDQRTHLTTVNQEPGVQPRTRLRAPILLKADTQASDRSIASALGITPELVFRIRKRFVEAGLETMLTRRHRPGSRPGGKSLLDGEAEAQLVALAQGAPPTGQKCWTLALLANALIERGLVQSISRHTVREKLLKYGVRLSLGGAQRKLDTAQE
jgi:transposase